MDEILLVNSTNPDFARSAALCFMETWLSDSIVDGAIQVLGFQVYRADCVTELSRKMRGGGICFYINKAPLFLVHDWLLLEFSGRIPCVALPWRQVAAAMVAVKMSRKKRKEVKMKIRESRQ